MFAIAAIAILFAYLVFWTPNYLVDPANYEPANPLKTPPEITPEWYFLPFYTILRSIPSKLGGVIAMFGAIFVLFIIPWLDTSRVRSIRYRPIFRWFFWLFLIDCLALGYIGSQPAAGVAGAEQMTFFEWLSAFVRTPLFWGRVFTFYYFVHFLVIMPVVGLIETPSPMPESIADDFKHKSAQPQPMPAE
jgi:ubiquinol-cytochrome c reductase cytochrome b subunit